jgi:hypothetical protein
MANGPITWKTVNDNTDYRGIAALSQAGAKNIQGAFDTFGGIVKDRNKRVVDSNTDAFTDKLNSMSMEQLAAGREDGSIDKLRASYGTMIDQDGTRNLGRDMLTGLRTEANATSAYNTQVAVDAAKPFMQSIGAQINAGDYAGAEQSIAANQEALTASGQLNSITASLRNTKQSQQDRGLMLSDAAEVRNIRHQDQQYQTTLGLTDPREMTESAYVGQYSDPVWLRDNKLDPQTAARNIGKAREYWRNKNSLSQSEAANLGSWEAEQEGVIEQDVAGNERFLENSLAPLTSLNNGKRWTEEMSVDDIVAVAASPKLDANGTPLEGQEGFDLEPGTGIWRSQDEKSLKGTVLNAQKLFRNTDAFKNLTPEEKMKFNAEAMNQITMDAIGSLDSRDILPGKDNLEAEALVESMLGSLTEYQQYNRDLITRSDIYKAYDEDAKKIEGQRRKNAGISAQFKRDRNPESINPALKLQNSITKNPTDDFLKTLLER